MRVRNHIAAAALGALILLTACAPANNRSRPGVEARLGPPIALYDYYPDYFGNWRTGFRSWRPVTIYEYQGGYYARSMRGARPLQVYRSPSGYFLPPRDDDWRRTDRRFSSKKLPTPDDYHRARPRPSHGPSSHPQEFP